MIPETRTQRKDRRKAQRERQRMVQVRNSLNILNGEGLQLKNWKTLEYSLGKIVYNSKSDHFEIEWK